MFGLLLHNNLLATLPVLLIRPSFASPPLEFWRGQSPSQAAKWRAEGKVRMSGTVATSREAVMGPMPGMPPNGRAGH